MNGTRTKPRRLEEVMSDNTDHDTTKKVERTDVGYRLSIESTRGTGTRDQDKVKAELRTETIPDPSEIEAVEKDVIETMTTLRAHQPDKDGGDE